MKPSYPEDFTIGEPKKEAKSLSFEEFKEEPKVSSQSHEEKREREDGRNSIFSLLGGGGGKFGENNPLLQMMSAMKNGNMSHALSLLGMKGDGMHMLDLLKGMKGERINPHPHHHKQSQDEIVVEKPISSYRKIEPED